MNEILFHIHHIGVTPWKLIGYVGVFLFTAELAMAESACRALGSRAIPCTVIGEILPPGSGVWLERDGARRPLRASEQDEIVKLEQVGGT